MERVHEDGFVRLVDTMPRENLDNAIVQAARVSYADGTKSSRSSRGLIRYLLRNWHTTPFEMVEFKFHIKMPIFVARQHMRHRMSSINEMSARYSLVPKEFYEPQMYRSQSETNRQGSGDDLVSCDKMPAHNASVNAFEVYDNLIEEGCCRELARCHLPQSTYTEFYWKINLHNLLHYLELRMEEHAQKEIRDYANAIYRLIQPLVPVTVEAFNDFRVNAITLSGSEIDVIAGKLDITELSSGEQLEFKNKTKRLGINI